MAATNPSISINNKAHDGYRRAGVAFAKGVTVFKAGHFNKDQLAMLEKDPRLAVGPVEEDPAAADTTPKGSVVDGELGPDLSDKPEEVEALDLADVPEELHEGLLKLHALDKAGELELNKSGKPNTDVLGVSAAVRDSIWASYQKLHEEKDDA